MVYWNSWNIKRERHKIDVFKMWAYHRVLRVSWTVKCTYRCARNLQNKVCIERADGTKEDTLLWAYYGTR